MGHVSRLSAMSEDVRIYGQNAIRWAKGQLDSTAYSTRCLAFVEDAIERANGLEMFGGDYAAESARLYDAAANSSEPPFGALVFYDTVGELFGSRRNWGHVGLGLGGGEVIHAWDKVRIDDYRQLASLTPAPGWEPLGFVGWVPMTRALEGSQKREWTTDAAASAIEMQADRLSGAP